MSATPPNFNRSHSEIPQYKRISGLAITTLVVSVVACVIALANQDFVFLPLCAAALAVLTLILMHRSHQPMSGYGLAAGALFASLFSFASISAYKQYEYSRLEKTAIAHAETWLDLLKQKKVHEAYQLHLPVSQRQDVGTDLRAVYGDTDNPDENLRRYLDLEPEKSIYTEGQNAQLKLSNIVHDIPRTQTDDFILVYQYQRANQSEPSLISCHLRRFDSLISGPQWHIIRVRQFKPKIKRILPKELEDSLFKQ